MSTTLRISVEEFDVDDPRRWELIEGELVEMPTPSPPHQKIVVQLTK